MKKHLSLVLTIVLTAAITGTTVYQWQAARFAAAMPKEIDPGYLMAWAQISPFHSIGKQMELDEELASLYGGRWYDEEGNHVSFLPGAKLYITGLEKVIWHRASFSMTYLESVQADLGDHVSELGIVGLGIREQDNRVVIQMKTLDDESVAAVKAFTDPRALIFELAPEGGHYVVTTH